MNSHSTPATAGRHRRRARSAAAVLCGAAHHAVGEHRQHQRGQRMPAPFGHQRRRTPRWCLERGRGRSGRGRGAGSSPARRTRCWCRRRRTCCTDCTGQRLPAGQKKTNFFHDDATCGATSTQAARQKDAFFWREAGRRRAFRRAGVQRLFKQGAASGTCAGFLELRFQFVDVGAMRVMGRLPLRSSCRPRPALEFLVDDGADLHEVAQPDAARLVGGPRIIWSRTSVPGFFVEARTSRSARRPVVTGR